MGNSGAKVTSGSVPLSEAVQAALRVSAVRGERVFLVGGIVRDLTTTSTWLLRVMG